MDTEKLRTVAIAGTRIGMGFVFLWPFLDKTFGLRYATAPESAWIRGGHPTRGYLGGADGALGGMFNAMADSIIVEWLFMIGLLGIGLSLMLGAGVRIGCYAGIAMLVLMWLAEMPFGPTSDAGRGANNPFWDDHLMYSFALFWLSLVHAGQHAGIGKWWMQLGWVKKHPVLE